MKKDFEITFYPDHEEHQSLRANGPDFRTIDYRCGGCGNLTNARQLIQITGIEQPRPRSMVCLCACGQATTIRFAGGNANATFEQWPNRIEFMPDTHWPPEIERLYREASLCFAGGAFTATSILARKALMACGVQEGEPDGKSFVHYVDFIMTKVLPLPRAKAAVDAIRQIGNEANHNIAFVSEADARRAMSIVHYMLQAIYSLPAA